jgi:2-polyprenyl-3-methyl-5-hydroxy-6-metoxy-1,4-benzoquinol methylase
MGRGSIDTRDGKPVYQCACGLVSVDAPPHDYSQPMHEGIDSERWARESVIDDERRFTALKPMLVNKRVLDVGCGTGGFLRLARGVALSVMGVEPYVGSGGCVDIPVQPFLQFVDGGWNVVTLFHVLEHQVDPIGFLVEIERVLGVFGTLVVEVPSADDALMTLYGCSEFTRHTLWSKHLHLFNAKTLTETAKRAGLRVEAVRHIQRYPLSNHLHWLARGKPDGHREWGFLDSPELAKAYEDALAAIGKTDTIMAFMRKQ